MKRGTTYPPKATTNLSYRHFLSNLLSKETPVLLQIIRLSPRKKTLPTNFNAKSKMPLLGKKLSHRLLPLNNTPQWFITAFRGQGWRWKDIHHLPIHCMFSKFQWNKIFQQPGMVVSLPIKWRDILCVQWMMVLKKATSKQPLDSRGW